MRFLEEPFGDRNPVVGMYLEVKRGTNQCDDTFVRARPDPAESGYKRLHGLQ